MTSGNSLTKRFGAIRFAVTDCAVVCENKIARGKLRRNDVLENFFDLLPAGLRRSGARGFYVLKEEKEQREEDCESVAVILPIIPPLRGGRCVCLITRTMLLPRFACDTEQHPPNPPQGGNFSEAFSATCDFIHRRQSSIQSFFYDPLFHPQARRLRFSNKKRKRLGALSWEL